MEGRIGTIGYCDIASHMYKEYLLCSAINVGGIKQSCRPSVFSMSLAQKRYGFELRLLWKYFPENSMLDVQPTGQRAIRCMANKTGQNVLGELPVQIIILRNGLP